MWRGFTLLARCASAFAQTTPRLLVKKRAVSLSPSMTLTQLADSLGVNPLLALQSFKGIEENQKLHLESPVSIETAQLLAYEFNCLPTVEMDRSALPLRPPIVTIMGHVDHGKTTLLDSFRNSNICGKEYGGITQGIGAFSMVSSTGQKITFIDTPGHKAFTKMRERGAQITDIVILVICAVEGVQPQTLEALSHAKEAEVPIIIALNKIDLPGADIGKIELQLVDKGIDLERFGGETMVIPISAKKRTNLDRLEEALLFKAELIDLREDPKCPAQGVIIESRSGQGRGNLCSALVRRGSLKVGDIVVSGKCHGKVKRMMDDTGAEVQVAGPSEAVELVGLDGLPDAGEDFFVVPLLSKARFMTQQMGEKKEETKSSAPEMINSRMSVPRMDRKEKVRFRAGHTDVLIEKMKAGDTAENLFSHKLTNLKKPKKNEKARMHIQIGEKTVSKSDSMSQEKAEAIITNSTKTQVSLVLKASNKGMLEALVSSAYQVAAKVGAPLEIVRSEVGGITKEDIITAEEFDAVILGMDVPVPVPILHEAKAKKIALKSHKIIYHLLDDIAALSTDLVAPPTHLATVGTGEVKQLFKSASTFYLENSPVVAGLEVRTGLIHQKLTYKVTRNRETVADNLNVSSLKRHKLDVKEVPKGMDCGIVLEGFNDFQEGDLIEGYEVRKTEKQFKIEQVMVEAEDVRDK